MTVLDSRGRLFALVNVIDMAAAIAMVALAVLGSLAYNVVRDRSPLITSVTPSALTSSEAARLRLNGEHFRPLLNAFVSKTGGVNPVGAFTPVQFLIGSPTAAELKLPQLPPGTYDIHLFDGAREIARVESAFLIRDRSGSTGA